MVKSFLHIGCGSNYKKQTTSVFNSEDWNEIRLDINKDVKYYGFDLFEDFYNTKNMIDKEISRTNQLNLMSIRNVFFIPKNYEWI